MSEGCNIRAGTILKVTDPLVVTGAFIKQKLLLESRSHIFGLVPLAHQPFGAIKPAGQKQVADLRRSVSV